MSVFHPPVRRSATWAGVIGLSLASMAGLAACANGGTSAADPKDGPSPSRDAESSASAATSGRSASPSRPNVVLITADDASIGDLKFMPHTQRLLAAKGVTMTQAIAPTPICVPARASLLTGQYAHNHGARTISGPHGGFKAFRDSGTLPVWLRKAGYDTLFTGKYLNGYGTNGTARYTPPGWSDWRGTIDYSTYSFWKTKFSVNGKVIRPKGYSTNIIARMSESMLNRQHQTSKKPFFMWTNYVAPHHGGPTRADDPKRRWPNNPETWMGNTDPAPRDNDTFKSLRLPKDPEMWEQDIRGNTFAGKPRTKLAKIAMREIYQQRIEALQSVDRGVAKTVRTLRKNGDLANTYVIFTSDNGYLTGHHNKDGKLVPYDRSLRIPVIIRGPGVPQGKKVASTLTNPDIAVSIAAAARAKPTRAVDGVDVFKTLSGATVTRPVLIQGWPVKNGTRSMYTGVRYGQYTYFKTGKHVELYDRSKDKGELTNVANVASYKEMRTKLEKLRQKLVDCRGKTCRQPAP